MKKITLLFAIILVAIALSGCGAKTTDKFTLAKDMGIEVKGIWYPIYKDATLLLNAFGDNYTITSAPSCVFEGEDKEFIYSGFSLYTNPNGKQDIWYDLRITDTSLSTRRGIKVGDTLEKIEAAYGKVHYYEGNIATYSVSGKQGDIASPCIQFTLENGKVTVIEIYYPTNVT